MFFTFKESFKVACLVTVSLSLNNEAPDTSDVFLKVAALPTCSLDDIVTDLYTDNVECRDALPVMVKLSNWRL